MCKRFVAIWFRHLKTDWMIRRQPELKDIPFVLALPSRGRMVITEVSKVAKTKGLYAGMIAADAKIVFPEVKVVDDRTDLAEKLLNNLSIWFIKYTPVVSIDLPDGLILDVSGCTHLWGSEEAYLKDIINKFKSLGYHVRLAIADTVGTAWAVCRYGKEKAIIKSNEQAEALMRLHPEALRIEYSISERLHKLGLHTISSFINMQRSALRRRFGEQILLRLDQALGNKAEIIKPVITVEPYNEHLPCIEPIQTATGIEIALQQLLEALCTRLQKEGKGLRFATLKCYRVDNNIQEINIRTNHPSNNTKHLFKLFETKIASIEPALGIEVFTLDASKIEQVQSSQETFWTMNSSLECMEVAELLDNLENNFGHNIIHRYLPAERHLPEHSIKLAGSLKDKPTTEWRADKLRPTHLLKQPQPIEVTAPIPDYPPMNFRYNGKLHIVIKADACERIESEWWLDKGLHRDYYAVQTDEGKCYWLFRLGHYTENTKPLWFIHGFFE
jgi:protein ImuB